MAKILLKVANKPTTGDPEITTSEVYNKGKGPIENNMDIRDRIYELVGKGNTLNPDEKAGIYGGLVSSLGMDKAQKLMQHAYIFNTRPEYQKLPIEDRIKQFYTRGSNDPDVQQILTNTNNLGYGTGAGYRTSFSQIAQELSGRIPAVSQTNPQLAKKILLKIKK